MWQLRWITGGRSQGPLSVELPGTTLGAGARRPEPSTATCPGSTRRADARTLRCGDLARPVIRKRTRVTACLCQRRRGHRHVHFRTRIITWRGVWAGQACCLRACGGSEPYTMPLCSRAPVSSSACRRGSYSKGRRAILFNVARDGEGHPLLILEGKQGNPVCDCKGLHGARRVTWARRA